MPQALAETTTHSPRESGDALAIRADALRAEAWAGEPFLRPDEDPDVVLAPGTARRRALDDGLAELDAGRAAPVDRVEGALRAPARARARPVGEAAAPRLRHRAAPPPGGRARRHAHRADRRRPEGRERQRARRAGRGRRAGRRARAGERGRERRRRRAAARSKPTRARSAATASGIRPPPARRSQPPASSRRRAPKAC